MLEHPTAMHVARIKSSHTDKQGRHREYESRLLRRTYREDGKVRHETLANLTKLPDHVVDAVEAALRGDALAAAQGAPGTVTIARSLPHGHVAAACAMAAKLGLPGLLGPACPQRDLAFALIISRVVRPGSKLSTLAWWPGRTPSSPGSPAATSPRPRTRSGWRCSTCPAHGWRARTARSAPAATPATGGRATSRSSTGCSPTPRAARSRSGSSRGTPPTPPRSPRSPRSCATGSG